MQENKFFIKKSQLVVYAKAQQIRSIAKNNEQFNSIKDDEHVATYNFSQEMRARHVTYKVDLLFDYNPKNFIGLCLIIEKIYYHYTKKQNEH